MVRNRFLVTHDIIAWSAWRPGVCRVAAASPSCCCPPVQAALLPGPPH